MSVKFSISIFYVVFLISQANNSSAQNFTIEVDTTREYLLHLPSDYNEFTEYPLLLAFHGGFGFNWQFRNESNFSHYADSLEFIVVYPQAIGSTRSWNTGSCCGWAFNNDINDVLFVEKLIEKLTSEFSIDEERIYATGFSSGAMFSYALACELSEQFAAVAPVSSSMLINECNPDCTPVPIIHLHAEKDSSALFHGGISENILLPFYYPPVDSVMQEWAIKNGCEQNPESMNLSNGTTIYRWKNCTNGATHEIWLADDGGHKWPGTAGSGILSNDNATQDFYATEVIWNFLKQHSKSCFQTPTLEIEDQALSVFPNPASNTLKLSHTHDINEIKLYNYSGLLIKSFPISHELQIPDIQSGIYFISIKTANSNLTFKVNIL